MDSYIKYHRKPYSKYLTIAQFNNKFDTNIAVSFDFDKSFSKEFKKKQQMNPGDYLGNLNILKSLNSSANLEEEMNIHAEIEDIVLERAKTKEQGEIDLKHIVHFKNGDNVRDRLMKGTKKNIEKLKKYVNGEDSTVRLSYKKNNKEVKISELNPDIESLKAYLNNTKIREVMCV